VSDKSYGKRIKLPVDSIPKAQAWLPDGALVSGVRNWGCKRAGRVNVLWLGMPKWKFRLKSDTFPNAL